MKSQSEDRAYRVAALERKVSDWGGGEWRCVAQSKENADTRSERDGSE